jgi:hypothetical protein
VSPHYERHTGVSGSVVTQSEVGGQLEEDAWASAAEALRHAEVQSVQPNISGLDRAHLEDMTINELWALANSLDVPARDAIIGREQLIAAIRQFQYVR